MKQQFQFNRYKFNVNSILVIAPGLMLFFCIATILWGVGRCLGLGDEGLYLLAARYPDEVQQNISSVYIYTGYLFRLANFDPKGFRIFGMILVCISAFVFWVGFHKFIYKQYHRSKALKYFRLYSLIFIELGALLHYQWFYMTPNYNTLIGISINISAGSILWALAQTENWQKNINSTVSALFFAGTSVGLAFFTKFPAGICILILYVLVIALWSSNTRNQKTILLAALFGGVLAWILGHFLFIQTPQKWWHMFKEGWNLYQAYAVHTPELKSTAYVKELFYFIYSAIKTYWPCYLIICTFYPYYVLKNNSRKIREIANSILIFAVMLIAGLLSVKAGVFIEERKSTDGL